MPRQLLLDGAIVNDPWRTPAELEAIALEGAALGAEARGAEARGAAALAAATLAAPGAEPADSGAPLMLTFAQWSTQRDRWSAHRGLLGVILAPADPVEALVPDLPRFALLGAEFPGPGEGRGYTQGRLLRERWYFEGELRARGYVRQDQLFLLARCGFNSFELPESELEVGRIALATFSAAYQPANDSGLRRALRHRS
jgi:uncharacterized protein (DUF934 family)